MFQCKGCKAKDAHIADLKAQLAAQVCLVNKLVAPQPLLAVEREASRMLDGEGSPRSEVDEAREAEMSAVEKQAIAMITGSY